MPSNSNGGRRRPTPQAHSDRLTGLYKDEDRKRAVRPVLCPLTPEQLGELTLNEILSTLPGGTQTEVLRIVYPNQKKPRKAALVDCLQGAKLGNSLSEFVTRLKHLKYDVQALFSRAETAAAYRLLVDTIGVLGPGNPVDPGRTRDKDFYEEQKNCVATACQAFCRLLAPDGQAAYFRNRCFNRTDLLYTSGLRFPETMYGFVWTPDLPTRVIFDDGRRMIYPPFPQGVEPPQAPGRFRVREQVDRVVGVRPGLGRVHRGPVSELAARRAGVVQRALAGLGGRPHRNDQVPGAGGALTSSAGFRRPAWISRRPTTTRPGRPIS